MKLKSTTIRFLKGNFRESAQPLHEVLSFILRTSWACYHMFQIDTRKQMFWM